MRAFADLLSRHRQSVVFPDRRGGETSPRPQGMSISVTRETCRAPPDVAREQPDGFILRPRFDRPPDPVSARVAGRERRPMAKRTRMTSERRKDDSALVGRVAMLDEKPAGRSPFPG
jgi:hypothetical protein